MLPYNVNKGFQGINGFGLQPCDLIYNATLTVDNEESVTVPAVADIGSPAQPSNILIAVITTNDTGLFVSFGNTAALPAGATFAAATSSLVPQAFPYARQVKGGSTISFISHSATANVSIEFYTVPFA